MKGHPAIFALALAAAPVFAQSETGTRLGGRPAQVPETGSLVNRARITMERFAACIVRRDPKRVATALDAPLDGSDGALANLFEGSYDSCLSGNTGRNDQLAMSWNVLRGALYADRVEHLVRRLDAADVAQRPLVWSPTADQLRVRTVRFGDCVMRQDPAASLAYVQAGAATIGEDKALAALKPALSACVFAGDTIKLSRSIIEASLAEAIYRATRAPVAGNVK